jgi:ABC-type amino acid transport substrate-binding protein
MFLRRVSLSMLAGLCAAVAGTSQAATPLWVSGEVPPYLWRGVQGPQGYAYELFQRVAAEAKVDAELQFYPWARALRMLQAGQADAALVITRTPEREAHYRWLFPVGNFRFALVTRAVDGPASNDIASLKHRRVGSMRASASQGMLCRAARAAPARAGGCRHRAGFGHAQHRHGRRHGRPAPDAARLGPRALCRGRRVHA